MSHKEHKNPKNFITFREELLRHLSATENVTDLSKRFGALNSNCERVDFVLSLIKSSNINVDFQTDGKNDAVAVKLREGGNEMFKIKNRKKAWEFYTRSICCAEENSVNLGLAYGNRSAVLLEVNLRKECLKDIERALTHNVPEDSKQKLEVRAKNADNIEYDAWGEPHHAVPTVINKNSRIQCASDSIQTQEDENFGRYLVATKDIKAGEILAIEKPFASLLLVNQYLSHCHECINLCYNLIPCKGCTYAMYCSETCRNQAFETYHKYECPILATMRSLDFGELLILPLKIAFLVKDQCSENLVNISQEMYRSDSYQEIHNLITNTSKRSVTDLFERATAAAVIFNLVKEHTDFFKDSDGKLEDFFKEVVLLHMQTGPSNFHEITELVPNSSGVYEPEKIASGAYAFLSLLNHSCSPNVTRFCYGSTLVLRAIQDIQKGEQCFDNYGYHFALMDRTERRKDLQRQYYFDCVCQACEDNWPKYDALPNIPGEDVDESLITKLSTGDVETAESMLQEFLTKLGELQKLQLCQNFCQVQEVVKQCFSVFGNKRRIFQ